MRPGKPWPKKHRPPEGPAQAVGHYSGKGGAYSEKVGIQAGQEGSLFGVVSAPFAEVGTLFPRVSAPSHEAEPGNTGSVALHPRHLPRTRH